MVSTGRRRGSWRSCRLCCRASLLRPRPLETFPSCCQVTSMPHLTNVLFSRTWRGMVGGILAANRRALQCSQDRPECGQPGFWPLGESLRHAWGRGSTDSCGPAVGDDQGQAAAGILLLVQEPKFEGHLWQQAWTSRAVAFRNALAAGDVDQAWSLLQACLDLVHGQGATPPRARLATQEAHPRVTFTGDADTQRLSVCGLRKCRWRRCSP
jgi:hypothetical protein